LPLRYQSTFLLRRLCVRLPPSMYSAERSGQARQVSVENGGPVQGDGIEQFYRPSHL
jgi:hypothetical protein